MAEEKSCWYKGLVGCGCAVLAMAAGIALLIGIAYHNTELNPTLVPLEDLTTWSAERPAGLDLAPESLPDPEHIRVVLNLSGLEVNLLPGAPEGGVVLGGALDAESFDLSTDLVREGDTAVYHVSVHPKHKWRLAFLQEGEKSRLDVHLPTHLPVFLNLNLSAAEVKMDFSGVPLEGMEALFAKGSYHMRCDTPNPLQPELVRLNMRMGEMELRDLDHLRFKRAEIQGHMGATSLSAAEAFADGTTLDLSQRMGAMLLSVPRANRLDAEISQQEQDIVVKDPVDARPLVTVRGRVRMGEARLMRSGPAETPR